jgi:beta-N-acetylhexosaminidase
MLGFAGVDWDLAPVADGNVDPRNPVIGVRSFGSDALHVAAHVAAFTEGLQSVGILACPKHFPGHGDTHVDSHEALPSLLAAEETLEERELAPFRSAIGAGASSVMTGHLLVPALDPRAPASLSHRATTEVLRGHLGFAGVVVTDAVEMGAVSGVDRSEIGGAAVAALAAGADVVCIGAADQAHALATCVAAIRSAIDDGVLDSGLLRAAALRRAAMRSARVGEEVRFTVAGDIAIVAAAAGRSVTVRADATVRTSGVDVIRIAPEPGYAAGETHWGVADPLRRAGHDVALLADGHRPIGVSGRDLVIETRDPWKDASMVARLESLLAQRPDAVVIDFGWPLEPLTGARGWITTRGTGRLSSALAVCLLSGGDPVAVSSDILHTAYVETS